jgi:hypothetical protein
VGGRFPGPTHRQAQMRGGPGLARFLLVPRTSSRAAILFIAVTFIIIFFCSFIFFSGTVVLPRPAHHLKSSVGLVVSIEKIKQLIIKHYFNNSSASLGWRVSGG